MATIITNMNWKATPDYNAKNGTAKEPDESGIVEFEEGTVARTDNVDIVFTDNPGYAAQLQSNAEAIKGNDRLAESIKSAQTIPDDELWMAASDTTVYRSDGTSFTVRYYYNRYEGNGYDSGYMSAFAAEANGEGDKGISCYKNNLKADITSYFSSADSLGHDQLALNAGIDALIAEIEQNIADGKADPTKDLQTKVTVNGVEWNLAELIDTVETMNKAFYELDYGGSMSYEHYAKMGISSAYVNDWASNNLSEEQAAAVAKSVDERIYGYIARQDKFLEENADTWRDRNNSPERAEYFGYGSWVCATNEEHREAIKELFATADYSSPSSLANIMKKYQSLMTPVFFADGILQKDLSAYLGNTVNNLYSYISKLFGTESAAKGLNALA